ncbi:Uncharacterised protein [Mycobacteroides abscessus subsp. massiliense]|uniref:Uncharacterized protein n=1 Tax=Mycobacteroides abscessus subsp. massiliense TaxID=1962118 RepID=A0A1T8VUP6_9MYCO|nr:Uncharacterised protein [Mycobacteroides abscessus subsp. massiliense]
MGVGGFDGCGFGPLLRGGGAELLGLQPQAADMAGWKTADVDAGQVQHQQIFVGCQGGDHPRGGRQAGSRGPLCVGGQ